jgi:hypothetical protein
MKRAALGLGIIALSVGVGCSDDTVSDGNNGANNGSANNGASTLPVGQNGHGITGEGGDVVASLDETTGKYVDEYGQSCDYLSACGNCDLDCHSPVGSGSGGGTGATGDGSGGSGTGGDGSGGTGSGANNGGATGGDGSGGTGSGANNGGATGGGDGTGTNNGSGANGSGADPWLPGVSEVCYVLDVRLVQAIPTVMLLIDQSGSMTARFGNRQDRWEAAYDALMNPVDGVIFELQSKFKFGLALYTSFDGGPTCPEITSVGPALDNYMSMDGVYSAQIPQEDTPTGEAIDAMLPFFDGVRSGGPQAILLATDGEPDTCAQPDPQRGQGVAIAAAQNAFLHGIATYILSVGDEVGREHQQHMANAGAGLDIDNGTAPYFEARDPTALKEQFRKIIDNNRLCIFQVDGGYVDQRTLSSAEIVLNQQPLVHNGPDGWTIYENDPRCFGAAQCIEILGQSCQTVLNAETVDLNARFECVYPGYTGAGGGPGFTFPDGWNGAGGSSGGASGGSDGSGANNGSATGNNGSGGTGTGANNGGATGNNGSGSGSGGACVGAGESCGRDGDCCSGICGYVNQTSVCVLP